MLRTSLQLTVETGIARRLPGFGYAPNEVTTSYYGGNHDTWTGARSVSAAPHVNAAAADGAHVVWTSEDVTYVDGTRRVATEMRTTYLKSDPDPDADGVTLYVRTTIARII
jgi:hypothetical protein